MKRITIKDVAQRAGVSISAVSYILNESDKKKYAPETVRRVREAAQELGYVPNSIARSMRAQQAHTIGVVSLWQMGERVFVKLLEGIVQRAAQENYAVMLCPYDRYLDDYRNGRLDGVVFVAPPNPERLEREAGDIERMQKAGLPFVMIHGQTSLPGVSYLYFDFYHAIQTLCEYLIEQGHRDITYVTPQNKPGNEQSERLRGYEDAMRQHSLPIDVCPETQIAARMPSFRAVIANKSETAKRVLEIALQQSRRIPQDFPVVAGNTENYSEYLYPPLTTTQFPFEQIGSRAVEVLLHQVQDRNAEPVVEYTPSDILRHQSG